MIPCITVTQEIMERTDRRDKMIPTGIIKAINETFLDHPIYSKEMNHDSPIEFENSVQLLYRSRTPSLFRFRDRHARWSNKYTRNNSS